MYSLDCPYFKESFSDLEELLKQILAKGIDPDYEILFDGEKTGEIAISLITF